MFRWKQTQQKVANLFIYLFYVKSNFYYLPKTVIKQICCFACKHEE